GADAVTGGGVVAVNDGVGFGGVVTTGVGALTMGGGIAVAGARGAGGTVVTGAGVSTSVGASRDSEAERRAMTPKMPPAVTDKIASPSPAVCSNRRRFG